MTLSQKERKALTILSECKNPLGIRAKEFGELYFDSPEYSHLFDGLSNQGNGACYGKKAWRAAGCVLGRLAKKGYAKNVWQHYQITELGKSKLSEN